MIPVALTKIKTRDGIALDGIVAEPRSQTKDIALIWIHGLTSNFYGGHTRTRKFAEQCRKCGFGFFSFNTRGHDVVARSTRKRRAHKNASLNPEFLGAAFERFEDCIHDIRAMIRFARHLGYKQVVLVGHSTGANKALYYWYKTRDRNVKGLCLIAPISDIAAEQLRIGASTLQKRVNTAEKLGKKQATLMPTETGIYTPQRYLSLFRPGSHEDVFPYTDPSARWTALQSIRIPLAVVVGDKDEHLDRRANDLIAIFRQHAVSAKSFSGIVIKNADHGFKKKEEELSHTIINWAKDSLK